MSQTMADKPLIVVTGVTGRQGRAVAKALLDTGKFKVRGFAFDADTAEAKLMKDWGMEITKANFFDKASLNAVLKGAYGAFLVTVPMAHSTTEKCDPMKEETEGKNFIDAAKEEGIKHLIFSGAPSVSEASKGKLCASHFDVKNKLEKLAAAAKFQYLTTIRVSCYFDQWMEKLQKTGESQYVLRLPMDNTNVQSIAIEDVGRIVALCFEKPDQFNMMTLKLATEEMNIEGYAKILSKVLGVTVKYEPITLEEYRKSKGKNAEDMANMFQFLREHSKEYDVSWTKKLFPEALSFEQWVSKNKSRLQL